MNVTLLLSVALAWSLSVGAAGLYGMKLGKDGAEASAAREERIALAATDKALLSAAEAIAKIEVKHVTVRQKLQETILTREVFRDCRSGPEPVSLFNSTIPLDGATDEASESTSLPAANPAGK